MPQLKSSSAREGTRQSSAGSGEGAASCRVPPHTCPPASGAVSSGLGFSPRCQRAPRLLAGAGVFPATLSPAAGSRQQRPGGLRSPSRRVLRCLRILTCCLFGQQPPLWSCAVSAPWGERWAPPCHSASHPGSPPRSRIPRPPRLELLLAVWPVSQMTMSLASPRAQGISQF